MTLRSPLLQRRFLLAPLSLAALASTSAAQASSHQWVLGERQGQNSAAPLGLLHRSALDTQVLVRGSGTVSAPPAEWSSERFGMANAVAPDFSTTALLQGLNRGTPAGLEATSFELASMSSGGDVMPTFLPSGEMVFSPATAWFTLTVNVAPKASTTGLPGTTLRSLETTAGDVISYTAEGSTSFDPELVDATYIEQTVDQQGFDDNDTDLVGLDWNMGLIATDPFSQRSMLFAPVRDKFYFSVTREWETKNPGHLVISPTSQIMQLEPNAIYVMQWQPDMAGAFEWSAPTMAFSPAQLWEDPEADNAIDALSVYEPPNGTTRVILSTDLASNAEDQLMVFQPGTTALATTLRTVNGKAFSEELGLKPMTAVDPDDVDGTCGRDPEAGIYSGSIATPLGGTHVDGKAELGLSAVISAELGPKDQTLWNLDLHATGLVIDDMSFTVFSIGWPTNPGPFVDLGATPVTWHAIALGEPDVKLGTTAARLPFDPTLSFGPTCVQAVQYSSNAKSIAMSGVSIIDI